MLRNDAGPAAPEGNHRHGGRQRDSYAGRIPILPRQDIHQPRGQRRVLQTQIFPADFHASLHDGQVAVFPGEAFVLHRQLYLLRRRDHHLQHSLVEFLIAAHGKGRCFAVRPDMRNPISRIYAEGDALLPAGGIAKLVKGPAFDSACGGIRKYLCRAAGADDSLRVRKLVKFCRRLIRIAPVHQRLGCIRRHGADQQKQSHSRAVDPPGAPEQRAEKPSPILPDAEPGERPHPGQGRKPGQAHIGHRPENAEIGKVVGQGPHAGIEPAKLPVVRPHGQAQSRKDGKEHQGKIQTPGKLVRGSGRQNPQGKGKTHKEQIGQDIIRTVKDGSDQSPADWQPEQHGKAQREQRSGQQGQQTDQRHDKGRDRRVRQRLHPAARSPVQLKDRQKPEQNAARRAPGDDRIGKIHGKHGFGGGRLIENQPQSRREGRQPGEQPGKPALQEPPKLQGKQREHFHRTTSLEMR